ncbi:MAG: hypothetical protein V1847_00010 [Candidatus Diapherotrites archaeon]
MLEWLVNELVSGLMAFWALLWFPSMTQTFSIFFLICLTAVWYWVIEWKEKWLVFPAIAIGLIVSPFLFVLFLLFAWVFFSHYKNWLEWSLLAIIVLGIFWMVA